MNVNLYLKRMYIKKQKWDNGCRFEKKHFLNEARSFIEKLFVLPFWWNTILVVLFLHGFLSSFSLFWFESHSWSNEKIITFKKESMNVLIELDSIYHLRIFFTSSTFYGWFAYFKFMSNVFHNILHSKLLNYISLKKSP